MCETIKEENNLRKCIERKIEILRGFKINKENPLKDEEFMDHFNQLNVVLNLAKNPKYNLPVDKYYDIIQGN